MEEKKGTAEREMGVHYAHPLHSADYPAKGRVEDE